MTGELSRFAGTERTALRAETALVAPRLATARGAQTLVFLFTDIEGSTGLWEQFPAEMPAALAQHDRILRAAIEAEGGRVVKTTGDGVMAIFWAARDGLAAALAAQKAFLDEPWSATGPLRVRMGLHVGEAEVDGDGLDFHGQSVNRAARIMASGHGGQALLSAAMAALIIDRLPDGASLHDLGEHRLKDLSRPERVYELRHPDLPEITRPLRTEDAARFVLPAEPSAFVGRETEREQLATLLTDPESRLVTLIGPGGIGKTRLALRAARDVERSFEAGAVFVDLSAARAVADVLVTISRAVGLADSSTGREADELARMIGDQRFLLILDNVEQVTSAAPTLVALLASCPQVHLLVTSREALRVRGERRFPVEPLGMPAAGRRSLSAAEAMTFEAVRLFVDRAKDTRPDFEVTDANASVLADICQRLEGVPLAIELATARLRVFSLESLRDRLQSQLRTLGGGARDLPERQQTLRATIEWSYQLLSPGEQRLFEVLACFAGTEVEAVEDVCSRLLDLLPDIDPLDGLGSLTDKSLLRQAERPGSGPRFSMLNAMREFATERIEASPELATRARAAHADHYTAWLVQIVERMAGSGRAESLDDLGAEVENLAIAWRWAVDSGDVERLQVLLGGLRPLYDARGWYRGLIAMIDETLVMLEGLPSSPGRVVEAATLQSDRARAMSAIDGYSDAVEAAFERVLAAYEGADLSHAYPVLRSLASFHTFRNEPDRALPFARQILAIGETVGDPAMRISGHTFIGSSLSFLGRLTDGSPDLEAGADLAVAAPSTGDWYRLGPDPRVSCLTALSLFRFWEGRLDASLLRSSEAVAVARAGNHPSSLGYGLHHASFLHTMRGEPELARALAVESVELATEHDLHIWRAVGTVILGAAAVALGATEEGMGWVREGLERYRGLRTPPVFWPFLLEVTANACRLGGETEFGLASIDEALMLSPRAAWMRLTKGGLLAGRDPKAAEGEYEQALAGSLAWGAATPALAAAVALYRLTEVDGSEHQRIDDRRDQVRAIVPMFTEGLDYPLLVEAQAIVAAG